MLLYYLSSLDNLRQTAEPSETEANHNTNHLYCSGIDIKIKTLDISAILNVCVFIYRHISYSYCGRIHL